MSLVTLTDNAIILLVLQSHRKQQRNTALDQGQHFPKETFRKMAKETSVEGVHLGREQEKFNSTNKTHV